MTNTQELVAYWKARGVNPTPDLVTTSGSGFDPDITPQDALVQIPMVSQGHRALALGAQQPDQPADAGQQLGFLGSPYINVLQLNEALAKLEK